MNNQNINKNNHVTYNNESAPNSVPASSSVPVSNTNHPVTPENFNESIIEIKETDQIKGASGSVVLANITDNGAVLTNNPLPKSIDLNEKKVVVVKNNKKKIKILTPREKRITTLIAIISFFCFCGLGYAIYYFYFNNPFNYTLKSVTYELGATISTNTNDYISLQNVDELSYVLDLSQVKVKEVGTYQYSVTYNNQKKYGTIKIVDTTPPVLILNSNLSITTGDRLELSNLVSSCTDASTCHLAFANNYDTTSTNPIEVTITATDDYQNKSSQTTSVTIIPTNYLSCSITTTVDKQVIETTNYIILNNTNGIVSNKKTLTTTYQYKESYNNFKSQNLTSNYVFDDNNLTTIIVDNHATYPSNILDGTQAKSYYESQGFTCN